MSAPRDLRALLREMRQDITALQRASVKRRGGGAPGMRWGTMAQRDLAPSRYWEMWQDTDGDEHQWIGNRTGGWRRYSGIASVAAGAWSSTQSGGGVSLAGRTVTWILPTYLEADETLQVTATNVGNGFGTASLATVTPHAGGTQITVRQMQLLALTTNPMTIAWKVIKI